MTVATTLLAAGAGAVWYTAEVAPYNARLEGAAERQRRPADDARRLQIRAEEGERRAGNQAYVATCALAGRLLQEGRVELVGKLLNQSRPRAGEEDLGEFAWHYLWKASAGQRTLRGHGTWVLDVALSPDGRFLASGSADRVLAISDATTGKLLHRLEAWADVPAGLSFSPDGELLAAIVREPDAPLPSQTRVAAWRTADGQPAGEPLHLSAPAWTVRFHPQGRTLAVGCTQHVVVLWQPEPASPRHVSPGHGPAEAWAVAWSPTRALLASAGDDHRVRLTEAGRPAAEWEGHTSLVSCLAFAPDGRRLVSGGYDDRLLVWDTATRRPLLTYGEHTHDVRCVAFSPDGRAVASGGRDRTVAVWDAATGQTLRSLVGHTQQVRSVAFAPDGGPLASASDDGTVRLWDWQTGTVLHTLPHASDVWSLAFAADG